MNQTLLNRRRSLAFPWVWPLALTLVLMAAGFIIVETDERANRAAGETLTPLVVQLSHWGKLLLGDPWQLLRVSFSAALIVLLIPLFLSLFRGGSSIGARLMLLAFGAAAAAHACLLFSLTRISLIASALSLGLLLLLAVRRCLPAVAAETDSNHLPRPIVAGVLALVLLIALYFRLYALNLLPYFFEGELSPYYLGATSIAGIFKAASGTHGPWAPLGLLYYLPIYLCFELFGVSLFEVRLSSVLTSVGTITLLFVFVRGIAGSTAALAAAGFMALDHLQIGWGRTDIHPHGSTTWPTILLCMAALRTLDSPSWGRMLVLALTMGLTWHQYPSGQFAVTIPWIVLIFTFFWAREQRPTKHYWCALALGSFLWCAGGFVVDAIGEGQWFWRDYRRSLGERVYINRLEEQGPLGAFIPDALLQALRFGADLLEGIFFKAPYLFHQDILREVPGLPVRTASWVVAVFSAVVLVAMLLQPKRREHAVLLAWVAAAVLPAMFSDRAYPKRASTLYPALMALAGIGVSWAYHAARELAPRISAVLYPSAALVAFFANTAVLSYLWFSPSLNRYGRPPEEALIGRLQREIIPGTRIITYVESNYEIGKLAFMLLPILEDPSKQPFLWLVNRHMPERWKELLVCPSAMNHELKGRPFYYLWPRLDFELQQGLATEHWNRTIYFVHLDREGLERLEDVRHAFPDTAVTYVPEDPAQCPGCAYAFISLDSLQGAAPDCRP